MCPRFKGGGGGGSTKAELKRQYIREYKEVLQQGINREACSEIVAQQLAALES
jgi:hypothetical protein